MKLIKTKKDYSEALKKTEAFFNAGVKKGTSKGDELEVLLLLIEKYEEAFSNKCSRPGRSHQISHGSNGFETQRSGIYYRQ
jgi:antitoxin component HigA of HigAB toxin-antitoxin module